MKSEVLTAVRVQITVQWDITGCKLVDMYQSARCHIPEDCNQKRPAVCEPGSAPHLRLVHTAYTKERKIITTV
jgi:hypothetical protein